MSKVIISLNVYIDSIVYLCASIYYKLSYDVNGLDLLKLSADLKEDVKKSRPPSYTDRILIHSLDDRREKLMIQAYDVCDSMRVSDHRPVCMTFRLEVNR